METSDTTRLCSVDGCGREHAAHGYCLMHYKRIQKHGSPEYRWGGRVIGRACAHCDRPAVAKELCDRHYQMLRKHGDPLHADKKKRDGMAPGTHMRRGYRMVCPVAEAMDKPVIIPIASTERGDAVHKRLTRKNRGLRDGSKRSRREWEHRKIAEAGDGEVVHHIDLNPTNNERINLHVFPSPQEHTLAHRSLVMCAIQLMKSGAVVFDRTGGVYRLAESSSQSKA